MSSSSSIEVFILYSLYTKINYTRNQSTLLKQTSSNSFKPIAFTFEKKKYNVPRMTLTFRNLNNLCSKDYTFLKSGVGLLVLKNTK